MIAYQFDQCFNDMDVIDKCSSENQVAAQPFPAPLSGTKDPALIPEFIALGNPVITIDGSFLDDNAPHIPDAHPGFVIIRFSYKVVNRQLTSSAAARILHEFKKQVADWFQTSIRNSIVIVTERTVDVYHIERGRAVRDWGGRYKQHNDDGDERDWVHYDLCLGPEVVEQLTSRLRANQERVSALAD